MRPASEPCILLASSSPRAARRVRPRGRGSVRGRSAGAASCGDGWPASARLLRASASGASRGSRSHRKGSAAAAAISQRRDVRPWWPAIRADRFEPSPLSQNGARGHSAQGLRYCRVKALPNQPSMTQNKQYIHTYIYIISLSLSIYIYIYIHNKHIYIYI